MLPPCNDFIPGYGILFFECSDDLAWLGPFRSGTKGSQPRMKGIENE